MTRPGSDRLIFPLDVDSLELALPWVERLRGSVGVFKVGLELFSAAGPEAVRAVRAASGAGVFLDVKLHDIPATVEGAARALRAVGAGDAHGARRRRQGDARSGGARARVRSVLVLGVTRLTSLQRRVDEVCELARLAREAGCGGVVCSGAEAAAVRQAVGPGAADRVPGRAPRGRRSRRPGARRDAGGGDRRRARTTWSAVGRSATPRIPSPLRTPSPTRSPARSRAPRLNEKGREPREGFPASCHSIYASARSSGASRSCRPDRARGRRRPDW